MLAEFIALVKEQLHPQADAEKGFAAPGLFQDGPVQTGCAELVDCVAKGSDPREDYPVGVVNGRGVRGHSRVQVQALQ